MHPVAQRRRMVPALSPVGQSEPAHKLSTSGIRSHVQVKRAITSVLHFQRSGSIRRA